MGIDFPIPRHELPKIDVSPDEHAVARDFMDRMVARIVDTYEDFVEQNQSIVDMRKWKHMATQKDLKVYSKRSMDVKDLNPNDPRNSVISASATDSMPPADLMMTGESPGTVANTMHAVVTKSQQELALVVIFLHTDVADCAMLSTMEPPTEEDPYHFLGYKLFVKKSPVNANIVKHRDSLYLEACGTVTISTGEVLGYHIMHSVDLPGFPSLKDRNCIRANQSVSYLYRQKFDNVVEVFMIGSMDINGLIIKPISSVFVVETLFGIARLIDCAEVKRLTEMVRQRQGTVELIEPRSKNDECALCRQKKKMFSTSGIAECNVCGKYVCSRCRSTKRIFISDGILGRFQKINCCKTCVLAANNGYDLPASARIRIGRHGTSATMSATGSNHSGPRSDHGSAFGPLPPTVGSMNHRHPLSAPTNSRGLRYEGKRTSSNASTSESGFDHHHGGSYGHSDTESVGYESNYSGQSGGTPSAARYRQNHRMHSDSELSSTSTERTRRFSNHNDMIPLDFPTTSRDNNAQPGPSPMHYQRQQYAPQQHQQYSHHPHHREYAMQYEPHQYDSRDQHQYPSHQQDLYEQPVHRQQHQYQYQQRQAVPQYQQMQHQSPYQQSTSSYQQPAPTSAQLYYGAYQPPLTRMASDPNQTTQSLQPYHQKAPMMRRNTADGSSGDASANSSALSQTDLFKQIMDLRLVAESTYNTTQQTGEQLSTDIRYRQASDPRRC